MTNASIRSSKATVLNTSRLYCNAGQGMLHDALAPDSETSPIACTRNSSIDQRALRLIGAAHDPP